MTENPVNWSVRPLPFPVKYIDNHQGNTGFGHGDKQLALHAANGADYLLLLTPDTLPFYDMSPACFASLKHVRGRGSGGGSAVRGRTPERLQA